MKDHTFLFTDIEGSTRLAQEYVDEYVAALQKHNTVLKAKLEQHGGIIFQIIGDAFCCAFENAGDAVRAAADIQKALTEKLTDSIRISVRIGIHTGPAERKENNFSGYLTLARTARIMSSAYGDQIIVSNDTYKAAGGPEAAGIELLGFKDLGERKLKDLIQPIRLYQVISKDLRDEFPPLKTLDFRPNNLPYLLTSFIGREYELKKAKELFNETRLLTFTGAGGSGKTRLALQMAAEMTDEFSGGVWLIDLASATDEEKITASVIKALNIEDAAGKSESDLIVSYLKNKQILLILDNSEHIIKDASVFAEETLVKCPGVKIIATSREALRCHGELTFSVLPFETPDPEKKHSPESLMMNDAVRLFAERAEAIQGNFELSDENAKAVISICRTLDGLPLAIELAVARIRSLTVEKINDRLRDRFTLLTGGKRTALPRQQTLKTMIDWSYELLTEPEKILWVRISVFTGGWTLEAAEAICCGDSISNVMVMDLLGELTDKSMISYKQDTGRYSILESLKQYGLEKLNEIGDKDKIRTAHLEYFSSFAVNTEPELYSKEEEIWLEKLNEDYDNLQSAISWSVKKHFYETGAKLAAALGEFWQRRGYYHSGLKQLDCFLKNPGSISSDLYAKVLYRAASMYLFLGNFEKAGQMYEESRKIFEEEGDEISVLLSINGKGSLSLYRGDYKNAQKIFSENLRLARKLKENRIIATSLNNLGNIEYSLGNYDKAGELYEESLLYRRKTGNKNGIAIALLNLGNIAVDKGDYDLTRKYFEEGLELSKITKNKRLIANCLTGLANLEFINKNFEAAKKITLESLEIDQETGDRRGIPRSLNNLGLIEYLNENFEKAKSYHLESLALVRETGEKSGIAETLNALGNVEFSLGNHEDAKKYFSEALEIKKELGEKAGIIESMMGFAGIYIAGGEPEKGVTLLGAAESELLSMGKIQQTAGKFYLENIKQMISKDTFSDYDKYYSKGKTLMLEDAISMYVKNEM